MKKTILILAGMLSAAFVQAQNHGYTWGKTMGGGSFDYAYSVAVDAAGNVYSTGYFQDTADFDPGPAVNNLIASGTQDVFVSKVDAAGNFVWAKRIGGTGFETAFSIALDGAGNVYVTGYYEGTVDFDPGAGTNNLTVAGAADAFVLKLSSAGNFVWARSLGGTLHDYAYSVAVDASGNVYTTGYFKGTADFDPGAGTSNLTVVGQLDIFVSKLDATGNFVWVKQLGGTSFEEGNALTVDGSGNVYITGYFYGTVDFDPGAGTSNLTSAGVDDIFVCKLDGSGNFVWAKNMGGTSSDNAQGIYVDGSGNVYTTGYFKGTSDFDPGAGNNNMVSAGGEDIFVCKLDASGNFGWARKMGGTSDERGEAITGDASGNIYTVGSFRGTADFNPGAGTFNLYSNGNSDICFSRLDASGNFGWAKGMGAFSTDEGQSVAVDASGNVYAAGAFQGKTDFDPGMGVDTIWSNGSFDIFVHKMGPCTPFDVTTTTNGGTISANLAGASYQWYSCSLDSNLAGQTSQQLTVPMNGSYAVIITVGTCSDTSACVTFNNIGIPENHLQGYHLYPNPNKGLFSIELAGKATVSVTNLLGEVLLRQEMTAGKHPIDLQDQPAGIYLVSVSGAEKRSISKLVKE